MLWPIFSRLIESAFAPTKSRFRVVVAAAAFFVVACEAPTAPSAFPTIAISAAGMAPREVRIKLWDRVTFVNNDARPHSIVSDPVDVHTQCPHVNRVALLQPGESRDTHQLDFFGDCRFHDHLNQSDNALTGRIVVEPR
jgi:plastocyanin